MSDKGAWASDPVTVPKFQSSKTVGQQMVACGIDGAGMTGDIIYMHRAKYTYTWGWLKPKTLTWKSQVNSPAEGQNSAWMVEFPSN